MSNRRRHRPSRPDRDALDLGSLAIAIARLSGCNCQPTTRTTTAGYGIGHVTVEHDDWCALLLKRSAPWN